jgi:RNA polymerase sigma-70 factor (ECF subfamily)
MNKQRFKKEVFSLSERLYPMVFRLLRNKVKVEDALQEIMLKLWLKRKQIKNHPNINGLVFLTAKNYCIDILRKNNPEIDDSTLYFNFLKSENGHEQLEWKELNQVILEILEKLPKDQSKILIMRDLDGFEFHEISSLTELKIEHVRVLLSRARKEVRLKLKDNYSYER